ncbi:efflux RND transporter periplasmic adaptor subunit [Aureimonas populi]|uniref:Efflux RND transporter periplasmic adaptor subunit n=1 Tax=Aureimonas populi TaxID=1701758 RepID=A0ABW5CGD9_9HYPH|nr:efflux RND transporter periplasmic adaptor subunit [Aureimonas populi]
MAVLKQLLATFLVVLIAAMVWISLDETPGRYLLAEDSPLPGALRPAVAAIARAPEAGPVGATPQRGGTQGLAPLVVVDAAIPDVTRDRLRAVGTGEARRSVAIFPQDSGIVTQVAFRPGQDVAEGELLARLDDRDQRLAVERAEIALAAAEEQFARYQRLGASASVTTVQIDEMRRAADTARLDLRAAELALDRRSIVSPIDGRIGLAGVETGSLIGTQTLVATVDDRTELKLVFHAPEAFLPDLSIGHPVEATPTTRNGRVYQGEISAIDSRIDETSRTIRVEAAIDNAADELRPGMSFSVEVAFAGQEFLSVDPLAVQWERSGAFVWALRGETAHKAPIRIVERNVERILVASDAIGAGDAVIVEGVQSLREGISVRVRNPLPVPAAEDVPSAGLPEAMGDGTPLADEPAGPGQRADAEGPNSEFAR